MDNEYLQPVGDILIVDNSVANLQALSHLLSDAGYEVRTAKDGLHALSIIDEAPADLILLDIKMPGMDGFEVCRFLKKDTKTQSIPIIFISALDKLEEKMQAFEVGGVDYITKPFQAREVLVRVKTHLSLYQLQNKLELQVAERTATLEKTAVALREEIAERKKAEIALRESEEKYRLLHENAGLGIGYFTPQGIVISFNSIASRDMNGVPEDFIGKSIFHLFPIELADSYFTRIQKAINADVSEVYVDFVHLPTQRKWFLSAYTKIVNSKNEIVGIQIISQDITALKQSELALRQSTQLLEASQSIAQVGGWELDVATNDLYWTAETYRIHDTTPEEFHPNLEEGIGYYLPQSRRLLLAAIEAAIKHGEGYDLVLEKLTTKGRRINVRTTCEVTFHQGRPAKLTGIFQDITERKKLEKQILDSRDRLQALTQKVFTAQEDERRLVAHDLHDDVGQSLTVLRLNLQALRHDHTDPQFQERLTDAIDLTQVASDKIRTVSYGLHPPTLETLGLNAALDSLCQAFMKHTGIQIEYIGEEVKKLSSTGKICLYRILQEGLNNAARHAKAKQIDVIFFENEADIVLEIRDDGQGFESDVLNVEQLNGLGLLGMRERVELVNGRFHLQSASGKGTHIRVEVPKGQKDD